MITQARLKQIEELPLLATRGRWRAGTKVGRTLYADDKLIGVLDNVCDAAFVAQSKDLVYELCNEIKRLHAFLRDQWP